jgi:hypothetical protein
VISDVLATQSQATPIRLGCAFKLSKLFTQYLQVHDSLASKLHTWQAELISLTLQLTHGDCRTSDHELWSRCRAGKGNALKKPCARRYTAYGEFEEDTVPVTFLSERATLITALHAFGLICSHRLIEPCICDSQPEQSCFLEGGPKTMLGPNAPSEHCSPSRKQRVTTQLC